MGGKQLLWVKTKNKTKKKKEERKKEEKGAQTQVYQQHRCKQPVALYFHCGKKCNNYFLHFAVILKNTFFFFYFPDRKCVKSLL